MRKMMSAVALIVLITAACGLEEINDFFAGAAAVTDDLTSDPDKMNQAAGTSVGEVDTHRTAENRLDRALEAIQEDPDNKDEAERQIQRAINQRPDDPRYQFDLAMINADTDPNATLGYMGRGARIYRAQHEGRSPEELDRRITEMTLDSAHDWLIRYPEGSSARTKLTNFYCGVLESYGSMYGHTFLGGVYYGFADKDPCPNL